MRGMTEVRQLLKQFGTIIYTGDPLGDVELMMEEVRELKSMGLIDPQTFQKAMAVLLQQSARFSRRQSEK